MIELLSQLNFWHWLAFGLILLAAELLGTAGYFLWLGLSALLVGVLLAVMPMGWQLQWLAFASFSLVTTWLWWRRQFNQDKKQDAERDLNQKDKQLLGRVIQITEDTPAGEFQISLGDTRWTARCEQDLEQGSRVSVIAIDGIILIVRPI
ncbi:putative Inner membrane protein [Vibrio mimicus]|uniref:NfeD family protein n=1 Tax=Vibrio mimicus TaxID=674 RepID=UPI0002BB5D30|nr:NfeD family protein [Vibrio mimicus]EMB51748.1 putative Inner membrane protein [Vibrio mimicus CAIM 602]MBY7673400.1 NfeD family protein [Vibrio mimicus]MBY7724825.1 NfeD family protein [Vibrio mimicus]TXY31663.1 NfeD family protein [Vibrio mimicus]SUP09464.1 putative Inner membrane protein [Vibrio mimicus]